MGTRVLQRHLTRGYRHTKCAPPRQEMIPHRITKHGPRPLHIVVTQQRQHLTDYDHRYRLDEMWGGICQGVTSPDELAVVPGHVRRVLVGELDTYQMEKRYFHKLGHVGWVVLSVSFFFFQAEDGIRDLTVTGVQTCALPI